MAKIVGDEAVNAEDHTTICGEEEPAYRKTKERYAHRERDREAQRISVFIEYATVTRYEQQQPLQKVTRSKQN